LSAWSEGAGHRREEIPAMKEVIPKRRIVSLEGESIVCACVSVFLGPMAAP
jgi:hypothetical protein